MALRGRPGPLRRRPQQVAAGSLPPSPALPCREPATRAVGHETVWPLLRPLHSSILRSQGRSRPPVSPDRLGNPSRTARPRRRRYSRRSLASRRVPPRQPAPRGPPSVSADNPRCELRRSDQARPSRDRRLLRRSPPRCAQRWIWWSESGSDWLPGWQAASYRSGGSRIRAATNRADLTAGSGIRLSDADRTPATQTGFGVCATITFFLNSSSISSSSRTSVGRRTKVLISSILSCSFKSP